MDWHMLPPASWVRRLRHPSPTVNVVRLHGIIMAHGSRLRPALSLAAVAGQLEQAFQPRGQRAVALAINSPGGSPVQAALIHDRVRALAEETRLPVFSFVEDVAASGGYWLALAGDEIHVDRSSVLGSIGVISAGFGFQGLIDKIGVERRLHTSGEKKSFLDPFQPESEEDVKRLAALQKEIHATFRQAVERRREGRLKGGPRTLFSGEFWTGAKALELGLADGIGDLRSVLRQRYGQEVRLRLIEPRQSFLRRRMGVATEAPALLDGLLEAAEARALWSRYGL
jgi:signal peptide peptidase SppA